MFEHLVQLVIELGTLFCGELCFADFEQTVIETFEQGRVLGITPEVSPLRGDL